MRIRSFLFLHRKFPRADDDFDLALTAAAFDQEARLVLLDDGVYWLSRGLPELLTEAVEDIAVERESLTERGLDLACAGDLTLIGRTELAAMIPAFELVIGE